MAIENNPNDAKTNVAADENVDVAFRRIVVVSTAIGMAAALGSEACLEKGADHGFDFHWHWRALLWMAMGAAVAARLWQLLWRVEDYNVPADRTRLSRFCVGLLILALGMFVYPITFVTGGQLKEVVIGLSLATAVLTFVGWMIYRVVQGLTRSDEDNKAN